MALERLDFMIPDFVRTSWVSTAARDYWQSKINAVSNSWKYIERASLMHGMRSGILQSISPEEMPQIHNWANSNNLPMITLDLEGAPLSYGNAALPYDSSKPFNYRVYFGKEPDRFWEAWKLEDNFTIGEMLGFPQCCVKFFNLHWRQESWRDFTALTFHADLKNLAFNNVLLRHIGIRGVFHLPCSTSCRDSVDIGIKISELWQKAGYNQEGYWWRELIGMPMKWSSLHGVAIVTTPILKMVYASDPLMKMLEFNLKSPTYPKFGAVGNVFPFAHTKPLRFFNGFKTAQGMQDAHYFILSAIPKVLGGRVLDLGCGNGQLLAAIKERHPAVEVYGVEADPKHLLDHVKGPTFWLCDLYEGEEFWELHYDLTLIAIQRLFEVSKEKAVALIERIHARSDKLLVYSYDGWYNGLDAILDKHFAVISTSRDPIPNYESKLLERKQ